MFKGCHKQGQSVFIRAYKWIKETVDKASDETINKTYAEHKQRELNEKGEKTGKALGKHAINLYSTRIFRVVKIRDVKKLQQDIESDPIIKDQMTNLSCLLCVHLVIFLRLFQWLRIQ